MVGLSARVPAKFGLPPHEVDAVKAIILAGGLHKEDGAVGCRTAEKSSVHCGSAISARKRSGVSHSSPCTSTFLYFMRGERGTRRMIRRI